MMAVAYASRAGGRLVRVLMLAVSLVGGIGLSSAMAADAIDRPRFTVEPLEVQAPFPGKTAALVGVVLPEDVSPTEAVMALYGASTWTMPNGEQASINPLLAEDVLGGQQRWMTFFALAGEQCTHCVSALGVMVLERQSAGWTVVAADRALIDTSKWNTPNTYVYSDAGVDALAVLPGFIEQGLVGESIAFVMINKAGGFVIPLALQSTDLSNMGQCTGDSDCWGYESHFETVTDGNRLGLKRSTVGSVINNGVIVPVNDQQTYPLMR